MDTSGTIVDSLGMCLTMESTNDPTHRLQLRAASPTIGGEPSRIAMCHCLECQRRTGVVISNQARFRLEEVSFAGKTTAWTRTAESGNVMPYHFCPICGSTIFWENQSFPGHVTLAIGNFADPTFPAPTVAVWEETMHPWVSLPPDTPPKHAPKQG
jgi:hypothetical protein